VRINTPATSDPIGGGTMSPGLGQPGFSHGGLLVR
jgi:hypothetical protein